MGRTLFAIPLTKAEGSKAAPYLVLHHVKHHHLEEQATNTAVTLLQPTLPNILSHKADACTQKFTPDPSYRTQVQLEATVANATP